MFKNIATVIEMCGVVVICISGAVPLKVSAWGRRVCSHHFGERIDRFIDSGLVIETDWKTEFLKFKARRRLLHECLFNGTRII